VEWRVGRARAPPRHRRAAPRRRPPGPPPAPAAPGSYGSAFGLGAPEDGDHFRSLARDAQQLPASLPHVGAPPDQLLPFMRGRAKDPQVRYLFPLGGVRFGRRRHGEAGGRAISRVLFIRCGGQMVISLGWLSPATSRGLPAARTTRAGSRCLLGLAPTGGYRATPVAKRAVGSYPTFSPLPFGYRAVCSLWPCPSPCGAQALPGSLPVGARTFLDTPLPPACRDH